MSDQHDAGSLPELTSEQESAVRNLLAEARHDVPIPSEVADRLDTVLAGLSRDEPGAPGVAPVLDLAARRRRRNAAGVLAGAAAVIVAGFVGAQVIDVSSDDGDDATSTAADADREGPAKDNNADAGGDGLESPGEESAPQATADQFPLILRSEHLASDVEDQLLNYETASGSVRAPGYAALDTVGCSPGPASSKFGAGELFPALFDGTPAVLALRPPADGVQLADVLACDTAASLASVSITPR